MHAKTLIALLSAASLLPVAQPRAEDVVTANYSAGTQEVTVSGLILAGGCAFASDAAFQSIDFGSYSKSYFDEHASTPPVAIGLRLTCSSEEALGRLQLRFEADSGVSAASNSALDSGIPGLMIPVEFEGKPVDFAANGGLVDFPDTAFVSDATEIDFKVSASLAKTSPEAVVGTGTILKTMTIRIEYH